MQSAIFMVNVVYLSCVTMIRFSHSGKVCSGDFVYYPPGAIETRDDGILHVEGQFLTVFIIAGWVQFAIMFIVITVGLCTVDSKNGHDKERDM